MIRQLNNLSPENLNEIISRIKVLLMNPKKAMGTSSKFADFYQRSKAESEAAAVQDKSSTAIVFAPSTFAVGPPVL